MTYQQRASHNRPSTRMRSLRLRLDMILSPSIRTPHMADFDYDETDPLTVSVTLHTLEGSVVRWIISRDLLFDGTEEPSGIGDVRLWPSVAGPRRVVLMRLEVQGVSCLFEMDLMHLQEWLLETFQLVHPGTEFDQVDWSATVATLLGADRGHRGS